MSELEAEMKEIQVSIEEAKKTIARGDALERLMKNADFIAVIEEDYLREEAIRLSHLLDDPNDQIQKAQHLIRADLGGIAALKRYFNTVINLASMADDQIVAFENHLEDLRTSEYSDVDGGDN